MSSHVHWVLSDRCLGDAEHQGNEPKIRPTFPFALPWHFTPGTSCLAFSVGATLQSLRTGIANVKKKEEKEKEKKISRAKSRKYGRNSFTWAIEMWLIK